MDIRGEYDGRWNGGMVEARVKSDGRWNGRGKREKRALDNR
jgi:hypothetical protein